MLWVLSGGWLYLRQTAAGRKLQKLQKPKYQRRWCELHGGRLSYYKRPGGKEKVQSMARIASDVVRCSVLTRNGRDHLEFQGHIDLRSKACAQVLQKLSFAHVFPLLLPLPVVAKTVPFACVFSLPLHCLSLRPCLVLVDHQPGERAAAAGKRPVLCYESCSSAVDSFSWRLMADRGSVVRATPTTGSKPRRTIARWR